MIKIFKIPLRERDEVVSMVASPFPWEDSSMPEVLVVTKQGRLYTITYDAVEVRHEVSEAGGFVGK